MESYVSLSLVVYIVLDTQSDVEDGTVILNALGVESKLLTEML